jgi:hypothetical protein
MQLLFDLTIQRGLNQGGIVMKSRPKLFFSLPLIILLVTTSCATTKLSSVWKDSTYTGGVLKKVMVVGLSDNLRNRKMFEEVFTKAFRDNGLEAIPSLSVILLAKDLNRDTIKDEAERRGIDAILVTHLSDIKEEEVHYEPLDYEIYFYQYYRKVQQYDYAPQSYTQIKDVQMKSNLYETKTEKLIWSASSETIDPKSVNEVIGSLCKAVLESLRSHMLIK